MANSHAPDRGWRTRPARPLSPDTDFWAVFYSAPDAYLLLAPDPPRFTMVAANEARLRATMTQREDVIGKPLFEVFPDNPDDPAATGVQNLSTSLQHVLRTGKPHRMALQKYDVRKPDGQFEERYWDPLNSPVFDADGNLIYIIHRVEDVTDRVRTRLRLERETSARAEVEAVLEKLRASEERFRMLATMIPQQIWTTGPDGYHRYFSQKWYDYTGAKHEETEGEKWLRFIHPDDRERTIERWQRSLQTGEPYSIEYRFRNTAGEYHWFLGQASPVRDETGQIVEWYGTLTDISERKQLEEERERLLKREQEARNIAEQRREELERVSESRMRLMRGFSHDVKNPLGAADGHASLLAEGVLGELTARQEESIQRIRRSIQSSLHLINELLELARAESGQLEVERVPTDVVELTREAAEDFRATASAAGLELALVLPQPITTRTDPERVRQILSNLLSNAVKYTHHGAIRVQPDVRVKDANKDGSECIAIDVSDTGPGIPPDKTELIFQEFSRLEPAAQQGAGVGLAISRRIARILGGDITVQSASGKGSTFTVWLPLAE